MGNDIGGDPVKSLSLVLVEYWPLEHIERKLHQIYEHNAHGGYKSEGPY